jgi:competence protein ComEC
VIGIVLLILTFEHYIYGVVLLAYAYFLYKKHIDIIRLIIIIFVMISVHRYYIDTIALDNTGQWEAKVIKVNDVEEYDDLYARVNHKKVRIYLSQGIPVKPGDSIEVKGSLSGIESATIEFGFNYQDFLKSKKVFGVIEGSNATIIASSFHINQLPYYIERYINHNMKESKAYVKTFVLADKTDFEPELLNSVNSLGVSHLFAVSGLHVGMLALFITVLLKKIKIREKIIENTIILILGIYLILTGFTASITRASLMYVFVIMNKRYNLPFSTLDIVSLIFILLMLYHPYYYLDVGFVLSFTMTFVLLLSQNLFDKENAIKTMFKVSFIAFVATLPIVANMTRQINLITIIANVVFIPIITFVILPLTYITFLLPFIDRFLSHITFFFEIIVGVFNKIDFLIFRLFFDEILYTIIYYIFFFMMMNHFNNVEERNKIILNVTIFLFIISNTHLLNPIDSINFLDIKGESTIIIEKFDKCNMVIDTGEEDKYDTLISYLDHHHIRRIDYLIISHFHSDHMGEMEDLLKRYKVKNIISNVNAEDFHNNKLTCGNTTFLLYEMPYDSDNENNNSLMMSLWFHQKHYLFVGDTEIEREKTFIELYDVDIDYLKVGHHGSITSSSLDFITEINPEAAYINIDRDNNHGHPSNIVIERFFNNDIVIERTDLSGTIEVRYFLGKEYKKYYIP